MLKIDSICFPWSIQERRLINCVNWNFLSQPSPSLHISAKGCTGFCYLTRFEKVWRWYISIAEGTLNKNMQSKLSRTGPDTEMQVLLLTEFVAPAARPNHPPPFWSDSPETWTALPGYVKQARSLSRSLSI